jgi:hypothetical protein
MQKYLKDTGFNRGMGGSMHCFFPHLASFQTMYWRQRFPVTPGAALYKRVNRKERYRSIQHW